MRPDPRHDQMAGAIRPEADGPPGSVVTPPSEPPAWWDRAAILAVLLAGWGGPTSIFIAQFGIFGALLLGLLVPALGWRPMRRFSLLAAAIAFYFAVQLTSVVYAQDSLRALVCLRGDWPVLYLPIFLVVLQRPRARRAGLHVLLAAIAVAGGLGLWQHLSGVDPLGRCTLTSDGKGGFCAVGSLTGHLTYGGVMVVGFVTSFFLLVGSEGRLRLYLGIVTLAAGAGLITSYARTAWFGAGCAIVGGLVLTVIRDRSPGSGDPVDPGGRGSWLRRLGPGLLAMAAGVILLLLSPGLRERLWQAREVGSMPRVRLWVTAWRMFEDFPLVGAGLGAFKSLFEVYRPTGYYMATGHPHSDPLNALVHSGLAGLLAWGSIWVSTLVSLWRIPRRTDGVTPGIPAPTGRTIEGVLTRMRLPLGLALVVGFLASGLAQCYFTDEEPAAMLWFVLALLLSAGDRGVGSTAAPAGRVEDRGKESVPGTGRVAAGSGGPTSSPRRGRRLEQKLKAGLLPLAARIWIRDAGQSGLPGPCDFASLRRILLIRQDSRLGNQVLMTPFVQALRRLAPGARIEMAVGDRFSGVLARAPWVDNLIIERKRWLIRHPWAYPAYAREVREPSWDIAFELSNPDTHSFYNAFLTALSNAPLRVGFDHPRSRPVLNGPVSVPPIECHYSLAPLLLLSALGAQPEIPPLRLTSQRPQPRSGGAGDWLVHPGGRGNKGWGPDRFLALLRALRPDERERVRLIGGPAEEALLADLVQEGPSLRTAIFRDLDGLLAALGQASHYLGCDAGPLHLAAASGVATVSLFRASHPLRYAPLGEKHLCLLIGNRSLQLEAAESSSSPANGDSPPLLRADEAFCTALSRLRPRSQAGPSYDDADAQVAFVLQCWRESLASTERMCEDSVAGGRV